MSAYCPEGCPDADACVVGYPCKLHPDSKQAMTTDAVPTGERHSGEQVAPDYPWQEGLTSDQLARFDGIYRSAHKWRRTARRLAEELRDLADQAPAVARCCGCGDCESPLHVHGCYADRDGTACDDREDHR